MDDYLIDSTVASNGEKEEEMELRKGPWTPEEDALLSNYVSRHGEGRWNSVARCAGLKRTGKSCRLRWLNYLRPNLRRGNITIQEQLLILDLHCRWGNRWSKIAQYLPGRTDNEIKNYWRTRVQKQAKQLKVDVNSQQFKEAMRCVWIPRLMEKMRASSSEASTANVNASCGGGCGGQSLFQNNYSTGEPSQERDNSSRAQDNESPRLHLIDSYISPEMGQRRDLEMDDSVWTEQENQKSWAEAGDLLLEYCLWNDESMWFTQPQT